MGLTIYKSSAGSGKTFTLVELYLEKVLQSPSLFRNILAITFTNKATEEMKTRIIKELDNLSTGKKSKHFNYLLDKTKLTAEDIRKRSGEVLLGILHDYSSFSISTIDSYFQVLSRTLSRELNLPSNYDIELDLDSVAIAVSNNLLASAGQDKFITGWLEELLLDRIDQNKNWNIHGDLRKMTVQILTKASARSHAMNSKPDLVTELITSLKKIRKEVEENMRQQGMAAIKEIAASGYSVESFSYSKAGAAGYLYKIADKNSGALQFKPGSRVLKAVEDPDSMLTVQSRKDEKLLQLTRGIVHPVLSDAIDYYQSVATKYISAIEVLKNIYLAGIAGALNEKVKLFRDEFQLFLLSDTTRMLQEMVKDNDAPFIYEKSGNTYRHLFIDEFQDTAREQWEILRPLVINSLSEQHDVLIVGDVKQSIYRWRGGDWHLLTETVKDDLKYFKKIIYEEKLHINYRSLGNIVRFNNRFFKNAGEILISEYNAFPEFIQSNYGENDVSQETREGSESGGLIEFHFFENPGKKNQKQTDENSEDDTEGGWKDKSLLEIDRKIAELLSVGYRLRDIAILVRTTSHEQEIANHLFTLQKYEFISGKSLMLSSDEKINFILTCFRMLLDSKEPLHHYLLNVFMGANPYTDYAIPFEAASIVKDLNSWTNSKLLSEKEKLLNMPLDLAYFRILQLSNLNKPDPFIDKFSDIIIDFSAGQGTGMFEFLEWWDENIETKEWNVDIPEDKNAVRIFSIHGSKGLQFPVVIMPFLDWSISPKPSEILWVSTDEAPFNKLDKLPVSANKNLEGSFFSADYQLEYQETIVDNLNLLYVAFTRAEREIFVHGNLNSKSNTSGSLVMKCLRTNDEWKENIQTDNSEELIFRIGESLNAITDQHQASEGTLYEPIPVIANYSPEIVKNATTIPLIQQKFESDEIIFGNQVHAILSMMTKKEELDNALHAYSITQQFNSNKQQLSRIRIAVELVWDLMESRGWTDSSLRVAHEPDLIDELGEIHRPDRVIIDGKKAIVIDFKTGIEDTDYHHQVKGYAKLLEQTGFSEIEGYLIYTSTMKIEQVNIM